MTAASARSWYNPRALMASLLLRPRIYCAAAAGILVLSVIPSEWKGTLRASLAWDAAGAVYLAFAFWLMATSDPARVKARAGRRDDSRAVILTILLLAIIASFAGIAGLIGQAKAPATTAEGKILLVALAAVTIIISWFVTQVAFTLHYAHDYYRPDPGCDSLRGLVFQDCEDPDYWDFLYFAISFGAASQTSDTIIRSRSLRRLATLHAVISFFFNTAVLALTVNIAASLA